MKEDPKGVDHMCRISDEIRAEGIEIGKAKGKAEGRQQTLLESVRSMVRNLGLSKQQAFDALEVPKAEQPRLLAML